MGSATSIDISSTIPEYSAEQVSELIASLGEAYKEYGEMFLKAGIDGEVVDEFTPEDFETFLKDELDISNSVHRKKLVAQFRKKKNMDIQIAARGREVTDINVVELEGSGDYEGFVPSSLGNLGQIMVGQLHHLSEKFDSADMGNTRRATMTASGERFAYNQLIKEFDLVLSDITRTANSNPIIKAFHRAGPRKTIHFNPKRVRAAIVTCGGLCPGLNNVIRDIYNSLTQLYGCTDVMGIRGGYAGFYDTTLEPLRLTDELVDRIHQQGGTLLGSSRGGFDLEKILDFLERNGITQLYIIGGDGTHRGANKIALECLDRGMNIAVAGIPKTIDNDVGILDRSFGFKTSIEAAQAAIKSAKVEAQCNLPRGIGIVKLMGRSSGFIAAHATLASADVDLCLVPESSIVLRGEKGVLPHLKQRIKEKGHAVVVVAEGAGEDLLGESAETDASGNKKLPAIGAWIKNEIDKFFKDEGMPATIKYIDPSYMIRSVPANAADSLYCSVLAQNAVHGAMAGYTAFTVGLVNNRVAYIPIPMLTAASPRCMDPLGRTWERVLALTRQPNNVDRAKAMTLLNRSNKTVI
mmetsp:Transcript_12/g.14  ORF Transcript_12/g.14 Transcript_12/m.14 type:complete len:580 (+) Transcript_12:71-1810(+)